MNQTEILELKDAMNKMKQCNRELQKRLNQAEELIYKREDRSLMLSTQRRKINKNEKE